MSGSEVIFGIFMDSIVGILIIAWLLWVVSRAPWLPAGLLPLLPTFTYSSSTAAAEAEAEAEAEGHSHEPLQECAICLNEFKEGDIGRMLPNCGHMFHLWCINRWLGINKTCPWCREVVNPQLMLRTPTEEGRVENLQNVNLPPAIWCPRNTRHVMQLQQVIIETPRQD